MDPAELLKTVYLGDRACKGILIAGWARRVSVQVDVISRIRSPSGAWDYSSSEDIVDGWLVFSDVTRISFEPSGPVPNDFINEIRIREVSSVPSGEKVFTFLVSVSSVDAVGASTEVTIEIEAKGLHLEDPASPGKAIVS